EHAAETPASKPAGPSATALSGSAVPTPKGSASALPDGLVVFRVEIEHLEDDYDTTERGRARREQMEQERLKEESEFARFLRARGAVAGWRGKNEDVFISFVVVRQDQKDNVATLHQSPTRFRVKKLDESTPAELLDFAYDWDGTLDWEKTLQPEDVV